MFYIIETDKRPDGIVNSTTTARETINSAKSFYHERYSKMSMTDIFTSVALLLVDDDLRKIDHDIVKTMYVQPEPEVEEEIAE